MGESVGNRVPLLYEFVVSSDLINIKQVVLIITE